ncbi:MoaD/ThiS family protein [Marinobacter sp. NFXS9]|uniref:MoaD/ThiS family protein n=1 Tax=Marinobacter sp. NFXS9 TaxID=2818433 RepID=UPI0032DE7247
MTHSITVRLFAQLRELSGIDGFDYELPANGMPLSAIVDSLKQSPGLATALEDVRLMTAVNQTMVRMPHHVMPGDELALFPPVTGG